MREKLIYLGTILALAISLNSCAKLPIEPVVYPPTTEVVPRLPPTVLRQDVIHVVAPGETLWRISKMYDVAIDDIKHRNDINRAQDLKMGQRIVVPNAAPLRPIIPLYRSNKWKYIIVHHSATDEGNALSLFTMHRKRGFSSLGYHFVIDNGTSGKGNGQIEISPRWIKQRNGAHCKASEMNAKGIGICLVGNFSEDRVAKKQMDSLVYLVNLLKKYYQIPNQNVMGHGQVPGARTECPGNYFPWSEFKSRLK